MKKRESREPARILAIIPMRSGSKGIPDKNIQTVNGKNLYEWTVDQALNSVLMQPQNRILISTDSTFYRDKINLKYPFQNLVPFLRPEEYSGDNSPPSQAIIHALDWIESNDEKKYDFFMFLEVTSPLRCPGDINAMIDKYVATGGKAKSMHMMAPIRVEHSLGYVYELTRDGMIRLSGGRPFVIDDIPIRRQKCEPVYTPVGGTYGADIGWYRTHEIFLSDDALGYPINDWQNLEIDLPWHLDAATWRMQRFSKELGLT